MKWFLPPIKIIKRTDSERIAWIEFILKWYGIAISVLLLNAFGVPTWDVYRVVIWGVKSLSSFIVP